MTGTGLPDFKGKNVPFFSNIPVKGLADLMSKAKTVRYTRKEVLRPSVKPDSLFIVFYGNVRVQRCDTENSNEVTVQIEEPRACFGEIALLTNELRGATVITLQSTLFATIQKKEFNVWLMNYLDVKFAFLPVLAERYDSTYNNFKSGL